MFSEKYKYKPDRAIQCEEISDVLRRRIWNLFYQQEIKIGTTQQLEQIVSGVQTVEEKIADRLGYLVSTASKRGGISQLLENHVLHNCPWYEVYDFVEIYLLSIDSEERKIRIEQYNEIFEQEKAGYRIVAGEVAPITNESEIQCIESAATTTYQSVNQHIQKALMLYADTKSPDYENSIKESISAVEAMCCIITGMTGAQATLGAAIKQLKNNGVYIHNAMEKAFLALYGYTSDENGIRHGGIDFNNAPAEDAKYMLISCSAFVNYLIEKWCTVNS